MITEIILLAVTLYLFYKWVMPNPPPNFPPGPTNYPIVGGAYAITQADEVTANALIKIGEKYGPVTGMYFGNEKGIIVNGYVHIKEVLSRDEFIGRPTGFDKFIACIRESIKEKGLILNGNLETWQEQRRFTLRVLRDLGFGKSSLEGVIQDEIRECLQILQNDAKNASSEIGTPIDEAFNVSVVNILWHVMSGKRFKHDDKEFQIVLQRIRDAFRTPNPISNIMVGYPWLRHFPYFKGLFKKTSGAQVELQKLFRKTVSDCEQNKTYEVDFIHEYLNEIESLKEKGSVGSFNRNQLIAICSDLFGAGSETTSNSIAFAVLYMIHYPEVQKKIHEELDRIVGKDQLPSLNDRQHLVYLEAVMNELFRFSSVAPLTVPHFTVVDAKLNGYDIPKGTNIQLNLHSINMDKSYWGDPENFRPERFIDENGKLIKYERLMPFGYGKRICPGESLARMTFYLFFAAVMQAFEVKPVSKTNLPTLIPVPGFTVAPTPFNTILIPRK